MDNVKAIGGKTKSNNLKSSEAQEQVLFFDYLKLHPRLYAVSYHIPNEGKRSPVQGHRLRKQGLKAGVPDVFIGIACGGYHGLFIEFKYGRNKLTVLQQEVIKSLQIEGYAVALCYSAKEAAEDLNNYLDGVVKLIDF